MGQGTLKLKDHPVVESWKTWKVMKCIVSISRPESESEGQERHGKATCSQRRKRQKD